MKYLDADKMRDNVGKSGLALSIVHLLLKKEKAEDFSSSPESTLLLGG